MNNSSLNNKEEIKSKKYYNELEINHYFFIINIYKYYSNGSTYILIHNHTF